MHLAQDQGISVTSASLAMTLSGYCVPGTALNPPCALCPLIDLSEDVHAAGNGVYMASGHTSPPQPHASDGPDVGLRGLPGS